MVPELLARQARRHAFQKGQGFLASTLLGERNRLLRRRRGVYGCCWRLTGALAECGLGKGRSEG
jgi:hypothetical protein